MIYERFKDQSGIINEENNFRLQKRSVVLLNHQILIREKQNKEIIDFSTRRLDVFYAHINAAYSIFSGIIIGCFISFMFESESKIFSFKGLWLIPILYYVFIVARKQANEVLQESNDFEKRFLIVSKNKETEIQKTKVH
jgi:hypothetical protein